MLFDECIVEGEASDCGVGEMTVASDDTGKCNKSEPEHERVLDEFLQIGEVLLVRFCTPEGSIIENLFCFSGE